MGDVNSIPDLAAQLLKNNEFICDLARYKENLLTEKFIRKKYGNLDEASWECLGESDELLSAIEEESIRRQRDGSSKREKAQQLIVKGPAILDSIASDVSASPRHRVDALKTLDTFAGNGPQAAPATDRFQITIVLNSDGADHIETFDKSRKINPHDRSDVKVVIPHGDDVDTAPEELLPVIAANKNEGGGSGEPL